MPFTPKPRTAPGVIVVMLFVSLLLTGCGLSLAEDVTPPPNYRPPAVETPVPVGSGTVYPLVPPDPQQGQAIYVEKCLPCHGENGMGDGPQAANLPNPAAPIGSPELARQAKPVDWFSIVSAGNLERFMPGFSGSLDARQRWDVVAYTYSLSITQDELETGKAVYAANCADCHGSSGRGDGTQAASLSKKPSDWLAQSQLAQLSAEDIVTVITNGKGEMPAFDQLDEQERWALAGFVRSLSFAPADGSQVAEAPLPAESPTNDASSTNPSDSESGSAEGAAGDEGEEPEGSVPVVGTINIGGKVTNASGGGSLPEGMQVYLQAYDGMSPAFEITEEVSADGSYLFEGVEFSPSFVYIARVETGEMTFNSDILHGQDVTSEQVDLPIEIYDTTTDASVLKADRLHVFFDFEQPGKVQVVELFIISNPTDMIVIPASMNQPALAFDLPEGATNLQFENGELGQRFVETPNGFGDLMVVSPGQGQHQILFAYDLPYDRKLDLNLHTPLLVDAAVVMVPPTGPRLSSERLADAGERNVQGMAFRMYQATGALPPGSTLTINFSGRAGTGASSEFSELLPLILGAAAFLAVLSAAILWIMRQRNEMRLATEAVGEDVLETAGEEESSEALLDAIVALDDLYQSGNLPEAAYTARRSELKAQLAEALEREKK